MARPDAAEDPRICEEPPISIPPWSQGGFPHRRRHPKRMKLLQVITGMNPESGGVTHVVKTLSPILMEMGIDNEILSADCRNASYLPAAPLKIHALGPAATSWGYRAELAVWLRRNLHQYDGVICHGLWQFPLFAVRRRIEALRREARAPKFFIYPHGMLDPWFQKDPSRRMKALRNEIYWRLAERQNINAADAVLFTCDEERRLASTTFPGYAAKEKVVGYGVPEPPPSTAAAREAFAASCPQVDPEKPYLIFLSRLHPKKGIDLLIEAHAEMARSGKPIPDLVVAGPMNCDYAMQMKALAERLLPASESGGGPRIHFTGMLEGLAKWGALRGALALVLPSHQENFGIAIVESLACSVPVLISQRINIWKTIADSGAGLADTDDSGGVRRLLESITTMDPASLEKMRFLSRQCFEQEFSCSEAGNRLKKVLVPDAALTPSTGSLV